MCCICDTGVHWGDGPPVGETLPERLQKRPAGGVRVLERDVPPYVQGEGEKTEATHKEHRLCSLREAQR